MEILWGVFLFIDFFAQAQNNKKKFYQSVIVPKGLTQELCDVAIFNFIDQKYFPRILTAIILC